MNALPLLAALTLMQYPHVGPWVGSAGGGSRPYSGLLDWSRSYSSDWGSGIPAPTIDCVASPALPSATWATATCAGGTCAGTVSVRGIPPVAGTLTLFADNVPGSGEGYFELCWNPTGGAQVCATLVMTQPTTDINLGPTISALYGVYLSSTGAVEGETYTLATGTAQGVVVCNGNRSYPTATANGDQHGSSAITLTTTCALAYPAGVPPIVRIVDAGVGGLGVTRTVSDCDVRGSILNLTQGILSNYTGNLTIYPLSVDSGQAVNPVRVGSPTTVTAAGYPERVAVALNGSDQNFTTATTMVAGAFTAIAVFNPTSTTSYGWILGQDGGSSQRQWNIYRNTGTTEIRFGTFKADATNTEISAGTALFDGLNVVAVSYDPTLGDNQAVMRANLNGTAATPSTTARAPLQTTTSTIGIGRRGDNLIPFAGKIARVAVFPGWAASAADLALMVASQQARQIAKPAATLATVTSPATTCVGTSGTMYNLPANSLCSTASGAEIWGAAQHGNLVPTSQVGGTGWTTVAGGVAAIGIATNTADVTDPLGGNTATKLTFPALSGVGNYSVLKPMSVTLTGGQPYTNSIWLRTASGSAAVNAYCFAGGYFGVSRFTVTASWTRFTNGGTAITTTGSQACYIGGDLTAGSGMSATDAATIYAWGESTQNSAVAGAFTPTSGAPVSGTADAASVATTPNTAAPFCIGWRATPASGWTTAFDGTRMLGQMGAGGRNAIYVTPGGVRIYADSTASTDLNLPALTAAEHTIALCVSPGAWTWTLYADDALVAGPTASAALASIGTTLYVGNRGDVSTVALNGSIKKVCQAKTLAALKRCLQ